MPYLSFNGIYIIEDIDPKDNIHDKLLQVANKHNFIMEWHDLRDLSPVHRFDNIMAVFKKKIDSEEAIMYCEEKNIEGDYVECGVFEGHHPILACNTILKNNYTLRNIHMYDTYEGLVKPGKYDYSTIDPIFHMNNNEVMQMWEQHIENEKINRWCYCSLDKVKQNVNATKYPTEKLFFIKGDVMKTLDDDKKLPEKIAILRLDTDWYESSKFELIKLYDRVVDGGIIILDDYFHWDGQRRATDEFFSEKKINKIILKNNKKTGYFIK